MFLNDLTELYLMASKNNVIRVEKQSKTNMNEIEKKQT